MVSNKVTLKAARKLYEVVGHGLVSGLGKPEPGKLCVEAAVAYSLGYVFNDSPACVGADDREFAINLNDAAWSSNQARAAGLRDLSVAQLGSVGLSDEQKTKWRNVLVEQTIRQIVSITLRAAAKISPKHANNLESATIWCEQKGTHVAARAAARVADAADGAYFRLQWRLYLLQ